jgi:hypothetical protein
MRTKQHLLFEADNVSYTLESTFLTEPAPQHEGYAINYMCHDGVRARGEELGDALRRPARRGSPALRGRCPPRLGEVARSSERPLAARLGEAARLYEEDGRLAQDGRPEPRAAGPHHDLR